MITPYIYTVVFRRANRTGESPAARPGHAFDVERRPCKGKRLITLTRCSHPFRLDDTTPWRRFRGGRTTNRVWGGVSFTFTTVLTEVYVPSGATGGYGSR